MAYIALIEDEPPLSKQYCEALQKDGHVVETFFTREEAEESLNNPAFDAWVLDLSLDGFQAAGIGLIGWAKDNNIKVPILVVSGLDANIHGQISRELGVWDFVSKPIEDHTLLFKVRQLLNAQNQSSKTFSNVPNLTIDAVNPGAIEWKGNKINVPLTAWKILVKLINSSETCVSYEDLYKCVDTGVTKANLRQHISTLRNQFSSYDPDFDHIKVQTGAGYSWKK
ncbi:MAG: response regulator transcription factor [Paraglaciecola sp.]|nr:response regulator transcription factor [Paraglaciecola sp.]